MKFMTSKSEAVKLPSLAAHRQCYGACSMTRPAIVDNAHERAVALGFDYSCDDGTGRLLAVLAAAVPPGGRILEGFWLSTI